MTARAARMLAALEDGCTTRAQMYEHVGSYFLLNNGAAELREAGYEIVCEVVDGEYVYRLLGERDVPPFPSVPLAVENNGQLAFGVAA